VAAAEQFDLVVIGCGPAGEKGAAQAAYFGKKVAVIERAAAVGGSCINTGTVPSKTLRESALYFSGLKQRGLYGIDYSLKENLTVHDFMHHEREVVEMERQRILKNLELHKIELMRGQAALEDAHTVTVRGPHVTRRVRGEVILISTGSKPHRPAEMRVRVDFHGARRGCDPGGRSGPAVAISGRGNFRAAAGPLCWIGDAFVVQRAAGEGG